MNQAKTILKFYDESLIKAVKMQQKQQMLLAKEVEALREIVDEGIVNQQQADTFLEKVDADSQRNSSSKGDIYR